MGTHMKTTIDIADAVLREAQRTARAQGTTLRALVEDGLRRVLAERKRTARFKLRDRSFGGRGLQAGRAEGDWEEIRRAAYEGRGG